MIDYKADLNQRYWEYQKSRFSDWQLFIEQPFAYDRRPPVFLSHEAWRNVIINPDAGQTAKENDVLGMVPVGERHKWFRSMNSSQALAQSVFGNLAIHDSIDCLAELKADEGMDLFGNARISSENFMMEHKINYLREPRPTSLDCYFSGEYRIAIECKFTEAEVGTCSRPRLARSASNYEVEKCNGTFSIQRVRKERCSLTEIGVLYWRYVPYLFKWKNDIDLDPCPLKRNYQLVRNILAAGVKPDGTVSHNHGHAMLIYDERNPAFQNNGDGLKAYIETQDALREPTMLRKCSWQRIVKCIRENNLLPWLTEELALKYGL